MTCFDVWVKTVVQISSFVPLVGCIHNVVVRVIKIVLLASPKLVFAKDKFSNILILQITNAVSKRNPK